MGSQRAAKGSYKRRKTGVRGAKLIFFCLDFLICPSYFNFLAEDK